MSLKFLSAAALATVALTVALSARADDPAVNPAHGARLAYSCLGCHGIKDYRNAYPDYHVPKIGGQNAPYLVSALTEYRSGARRHPTMTGQAGSLDDAGIRDLAAYFAEASSVKSGAPAIGQMPAAVATCQACHGKDGVGILPEYPTLAGQHADYIEHSLHAYRLGVRQNAIMKPFADQLKAEDIHAVAAYFSQQQPGLSTPKIPEHPGK
jgi:cytochrome c553